MITYNPPVTVPSKEALLATFEGKRVSEVQTPNLIIDRKTFIANCKRMHQAVSKLDWDFRAHVKTHKTVEGALLQCEHTGTNKLCASTLPEIHDLETAGAFSQGGVKDVVYTMPPAIPLMPKLAELKERLLRQGAHLILMVDHPTQIETLEQFTTSAPWLVYLKLDIGSKRAGQPPKSEAMAELITSALRAPHMAIYGTYTHANFSYSAKDGETAAQYLAQEISAANDCGKQLLDMADKLGAKPEKKVFEGTLRLAVGATPTANAAGEQWEEARTKAGVAKEQLVGKVELHAGNYCLYDLQQQATSLVTQDDCAMSVGTTIISVYPERKEALCDAGAIAMSKDVGPVAGYGPVIAPADLTGWSLGRTSQEHGILVAPAKGNSPGSPRIGSFVQVTPQHACLTAAQHPWFLIVDGSEEIVDVWVPCKGW